MLLFIQIDVSQTSPIQVKDKADYLKNLVSLCSKYEIDGLILKQDNFTNEDAKELEMIRKLDKENQLILVSEGK